MVPLWYTGTKVLYFYIHWVHFSFVSKFYNQQWIAIVGYQIRSRHAFLKMLTGTTKQKEDFSFDNINNLLITSTILMVLSFVMEVVMYFIYNNKVSIEDNTDYTLTINK